MAKELTARDIEREFSYRQLLSYNRELKSQLNQKNFELSYLRKKQEHMIEKEVKIRTKKLSDELNDSYKQIEALKKELAKLQSKLDNDSTNSGISTSKTPLGKKKYIPNTREKTDKKIGGQEGHKKHKLKPFKEEEITEEKEILPTECNKCHSKDLEQLNTSVDKQELDYDVILVKRNNKFINCRCRNCGNEFHANIPNDLKEEIQYGKTVQALAVCLTNEIYTPFNKTVKLVEGITNGEIKLSEGYVVKLQKRASKNLEKFNEELKEKIIKEPVLGWDDGVIDVNTKEAIIRTYCTDQLALFRTHKHKNEKSLDKDGILTELSHDTIVMHDHLLHNYNEKYKFENVECLIHMIRRLRKSANDVKIHTWQKEMEEFLSRINKERNKILKEWEDKNSDELPKFSIEYLDKISKEYDLIIKKAIEENERDSLEKNYFKKEEKNFIEDLKKYKKNYLLWVYRFDIPSTNNNCERKIRPVKSKLKISGQFKSIEYAEYYANIRSYIESSKMNGINIIEACVKLMNNDPFTVDEMLKIGEAAKAKKDS